jgi:hypothetical protein
VIYNWRNGIEGSIVSVGLEVMRTQGYDYENDGSKRVRRSIKVDEVFWTTRQTLLDVCVR